MRFFTVMVDDFFDNLTPDGNNFAFWVIEYSEIRFLGHYGVLCLCLLISTLLFFQLPYAMSTEVTSMSVLIIAGPKCTLAASPLYLRTLRRYTNPIFLRVYVCVCLCVFATMYWWNKMNISIIIMLRELRWAYRQREDRQTNRQADGRTDARSLHCGFR